MARAAPVFREPAFTAMRRETAGKAEKSFPHLPDAFKLLFKDVKSPPDIVKVLAPRENDLP